MRLPDFLSFTPEERRAVIAILLFTGGGGVLIEVARRYPAWTPGLKTAAAPARPVAVDSLAAAAGDSPPPPLPEEGGAPIAAALVATSPTPPLPGDPAASLHPSRSKPAGPIDLNSASARTLESLPGVGPKLAERIVLDRKEKGDFRRVADLDRVKGIGPALLQKLMLLVFVTISSDTASSRVVPRHPVRRSGSHHP